MEDPHFVKAVVYGIEDSLISTAGVVVGMTYAKVPSQHIVTAGFILIFVEALSMGYGSYISDQGFFSTLSGTRSAWEIIPSALAMFVSYAVAGIVVLSPYLLKVENPHLATLSIAISLLFLLVTLIERDVLRSLVLTAIGAVILGVSIGVGMKLEKLAGS
jgi:VIT1/CCC1 family predicted Fe2+/Mn2+ transporter